MTVMLPLVLLLLSRAPTPPFEAAAMVEAPQTDRPSRSDQYTQRELRRTARLELRPTRVWRVRPREWSVRPLVGTLRRDERSQPYAGLSLRGEF